MRKTVLDHGNVLNVHRAVTGWETRWHPFRGGRRVGESSWRYRDGRVAGRINHTAEIETEDEGTLTLEYRLNGNPRRQVFDLMGQPCRFGGRRWLARCPRTDRLVAKLYGCTGTFQPRHLLRASYHSQDRVPATEKLRDREIARSCPLAWCSCDGATTVTGMGREDQAARVGRLTRGSSPIGAMLSSVM